MWRKIKKDPLQKFWEQKLNINYTSEFEYYKKLCGIPYNKKSIKKNNIFNSTSKMLIYREWKTHIIRSIECLEIFELEEYSRFLEQKFRNNEYKHVSLGDILVPFSVTMFGFCLSMLANILFEYYVFVTILLIGTVAMIINFFDKLIKNQQNCINLQYFYRDMKEIVDKKIKQLEHNERAGD